MFEGPVQHLIDQLSRLPGIGSKSAQRLAFHLLGVKDEAALDLARAIVEMKEQVTTCTRCFNVTSHELCSICTDPRRENHSICVVERAQDIAVLERSGVFRGKYHVLEGALSPISGIGPEQLRIEELLGRIVPEGVKELIVATNPNLEGDTTALYLAELFKDREVRVSRLASGLPVGGDLDYADEHTIRRALEGRRSL